MWLVRAVSLHMGCLHVVCLHVVCLHVVCLHVVMTRDWDGENVCLVTQSHGS